MQHGPSSDPFTFFLCSSAFSPYISTSVKVSNLASKEGSYFLLVLLFFFFFFACMDFPRSHFPFRQPTGRWKEDEEVGKIIDILSFAHRSIFVTDRSLERKEVGHARTCFSFLPRCHPTPGCPAYFYIIVQYMLACFFGRSSPPALSSCLEGFGFSLVSFSFVADAGGCRGYGNTLDPFLHTF